MSDSEVYTLCPACRTRVEPDGSGVVYAVPIRHLETMGGTHEVEGLGAFFHSGCFSPFSDNWRRQQHPE